MKRKAFIQSNNKQYIGALLAKYAIERHLPKDSDITVHIMNVDDMDLFKSFAGRTYMRDGEMITYDPEDLQSFTLVRFMPPELMNYEGRAIVIDPDIFAFVDLTELFEMDLQGKKMAACSKKGAWDSSVMLIDCAQINWKVKDLFAQMEKRELDYNDISALVIEKENVLELSRIWNNLDLLTDDTKMIHTTGRITQPWKTGLPIDFTRKKMNPLFGFIPREWVHRLLGKYKTTYQEHPDKKIRQFFFDLVKDAIKDGAVTREQVQHEIDQKHIRPDTLDIVDGKKPV